MYGFLFIIEPVEAWRNFPSYRVVGRMYNMLEKFYQAPDGFNYIFQSYIIPEYVRAFKNVRDGLGENDVLFVERAFYSSLCVFAIKSVDDVQYSVLRRISDQYAALYPPLGRLDGIFYLDTPIGTCLERICQRARSEENNVSGEYLYGLKNTYARWKETGYFPYIGTKMMETLDGSLPTDVLAETVFKKIEEQLVQG